MWGVGRGRLPWVLKPLQEGCSAVRNSSCSQPQGITFDEVRTAIQRARMSTSAWVAAAEERVRPPCLLALLSQHAAVGTNQGTPTQLSVPTLED